MAKLVYGPKTNTQHRHPPPPNLDLGERPCPDCGRSIRIVLWHGGRQVTPAERYELDGKTKHRCHVICKGCGQPILIAEGRKLWRSESWETDGKTEHRCDGHLWSRKAWRAKSAGLQRPSPRPGRVQSKPPKVKPPAPVVSGRRVNRPQGHPVRPGPVEAIFSRLRQQRRPRGAYADTYRKGVRNLLDAVEPALDEAGLHGESRALTQACIREWCLQYYSLWGSNLAERLASTFDRFRAQGVDPKGLEQVLLAVDKELGPSS
jgi:hypothetical protein